jgi:hypothetical protein
MIGERAVTVPRYLAALLPLLALLAFSGPPAHADPPSPPPEFQALYSELSQTLTAFETQIDSDWDGSISSGRLAAGLATANGNKTVGLLGATNWTRTLEMLDAFEAMGVQLVKLDVQYPLFTPEFHAYLAANDPPLIPDYDLTVDYWVGYPSSFYNKVADEIRSRGMGLWIEHSTLFPDLNATPAPPYFADMRTEGVSAARDRYVQERRAEFVLIASQLAPDHYTLVDEPTTQNANFGYFPGNVPILTPDGWRDLVADGAADIIAALPGSPILLGSGSGTWEGRVYTELFAALPQLDYIDFHHYPFASTFEDFNQNLLDWTDYVRSVDPSKKITLGESWLYKASVAEVSGGLDAYEIFGRDVYSFWEPLDSQYLGVVFKAMHAYRFEAAMPFWMQYYFAYVDYGDPALEGLEGMELVGHAGQQAAPNIQSVTLTGTGQALVSLLAASDPDGDGYSNGAEAEIGTLPLDGCSPGAGPDPSPAWPSDFVSGGTPDSTDAVTITDLTSFLAPDRRLDTSPGPGAFSARWDLDPGAGLFTHWINISDLTALMAGPTGYPPMLSAARAFNGPECS